MLPRFGGLRPDRSGLGEVTDHLRRIVRRLCGRKSRFFYGQADVARFFGVSLRTAHLAYSQLAAEGLLICRRGAFTQMIGRRIQPRSPPLKVVGVPIWTPGFVQIQYWRTFFTRLEEELQRHRFVADLIFYKNWEDIDPGFAERLLLHNLDELVWLYPVPAVRQILERVADGGVRVVSVVHQPWQSSAMVQYHTAREPAFVEAIKTWLREGVTDILLVGDEKGVGDRDYIPSLALFRALAHTGAPYRFWTGKNLDELPGDPTVGILFMDEVSHSRLARHDPQAMIRLIQRARTLFTNSVEIAQLPTEARIDLVRVDWEGLAARIAKDLAAGGDAARQSVTVLNAQWLHGVPAARFGERM